MGNKTYGRECVKHLFFLFLTAVYFPEIIIYSGKTEIKITIKTTGISMSILQGDKKTYTILLLAVMILAVLTMVCNDMLGPENVLPAIGIGNGTALGTFILAVVSLFVVLKSTKKASLVILGVWFSYFALVHAHKLLYLLLSVTVGPLGGEGAVLASLPHIGDFMVSGTSIGGVVISCIINITMTLMGFSILRFFISGKTNNRLFKALGVITSVCILLFVVLMGILLVVGNPASPTMLLAVTSYTLMDFSLLLLFILFAADVGRTLQAGK